MHVVACDNRNEDDPLDTADLLYWRGTDDGTTTTFGPPAVLASPEFKCDKPAIDGRGDDLHIVVGVEDGGLEADVWYFGSDNGGDDFEGPRNLSNNPLESIDPSVSVDPEDHEEVHLSWTDKSVFLFAVKYSDELPLEEGDDRHFANEDVIQYTGGAYRLILDGSDVGLHRFRIDALARLSESEFVLSFTEPGSVRGLGWVDDSDLVLFTAESLGENTSGEFSRWFDGSDVGLSRSGEDIDAAEVVVNVDPDTEEVTTADLYFSTTGSFTTSDGTSGKDEDVVVCRGVQTGPDSACTEIEIGFDGSTKGLTRIGEDVDAFSFDGVGPGLDDEKFFSYYSTTGDVSVPTASGGDSDVLQCFHPEAVPAADDPLAECGGPGVPLLKAFDGNANRLGGDLMAVDIPFKV